MNIPTIFDWRTKRNLNQLSVQTLPITKVQTMNYSTYSLPDFTEEKNMKGDIYDMFRPNFSEMVTDKNIEGKSEKSEPWLIRSALHMCSMLFRKISGRVSTPELSYHDCDTLPGQATLPGFWQDAKTENKNFEAHTVITDSRTDMNGGYDSVVASCEDKLNKVRQLITSKSAPSSPKSTTCKSRRRRRVFVESGLVEDHFEDAFNPEDLISESNSDTLTLIIPYQYQKCEFLQIDSPKMKIEKSVINIKSQSMPDNKKELNLNIEVLKTEVIDQIKTEEPTKTNIETVSSCESKIMQLQAMLKERRKKNTKTVLNFSDSAPEPVKDLPIEQSKPKTIPTPKIQDKKYKNRHRLSTGKRKKAETKNLINDDMQFADEVVDDVSSFEISPVINVALDKSVESLGTSADDCFDEVSGRFRTTSGTESDDSFQVVFTDSPRALRPSDCESEDSFIIFEDSPDSCYTSNDVFGDESGTESEYSDTDSEVSDSGCGNSDELKMSQSMTKTFEDLTDNTLYEDRDEVDNAVNIYAEIASEELELDAVSEVKSTGVLLNEAKKLLRKNQPPKKVQFSPNPPMVRVMRVWSFAARQARAGHWERHALDRERFRRRIADADMALSWVLKPQHRSRVMFQRFMPWWNAQRRKEIAEKKIREEEEKRLEEQRKKDEEAKAAEDVKGDDDQVKDEDDQENQVKVEDNDVKVEEKQVKVEEKQVKVPEKERHVKVREKQIKVQEKVGKFEKQVKDVNLQKPVVTVNNLGHVKPNKNIVVNEKGNDNSKVGAKSNTDVLINEKPVVTVNNFGHVKPNKNVVNEKGNDNSKVGAKSNTDVLINEKGKDDNIVSNKPEIDNDTTKLRSEVINRIDVKTTSVKSTELLNEMKIDVKSDSHNEIDKLKDPHATTLVGGV